MIKLFITLFVLLMFPAFVYAAESGGIGGFAQSLLDMGSDMWLVVTEGVPDLLTRISAWVFEAVVYLKFVLFVVQFYWLVL